jgi:hypothetical protein
MNTKLPKLPELLKSKIYKTGQTRGADDDVIFQNRVGRNSTVLIPYQFSNPIVYPDGEDAFENGFIVLVSPDIYFNTRNIDKILKQRGLKLGENCLVFYETRHDWDVYNPDERGWKAAQNRKNPLGGNYVARVPATTAMENGEKITRGFNTTSNKGAGIRQFEYASTETINRVRLQLEAVFWLTYDSLKVVAQNGMTTKDAETRRKEILQQCSQLNLLDYGLLRRARIIDKDKQANCPLCREKLSATGFFNRLAQAEGREVPDLTVTEINLFHIDELRYGVYNHKPYNLGWGHHHCNVVTKDSGIAQTLEWMQQVLGRNKKS